MYKLAVFDLDGTLLDTIGDLAAACNYALQAEGHPTHEAEAYKQFVGRGAHNLVVRALAPADDTVSIAKVEAVFRAYYRDHAQDQTRPYAGISQVLAQLGQAGTETAILSNKPDEDVKKLVAGYFPGLAGLAFGQREGVPIKPDPAGIRDILAYFGRQAGECVYFGDSDVDMQTGKRAGLFTVGVSWGFRTRAELETSGADVVIDKAEQIVKIVLDN